MEKRIGFIGIGLMGFPMAKSLLRNNYKLKAFNRTKEKAEKLKEYGAIIANTLIEVVKDSDVIITMLTDDKAVLEVSNNPDFLENLKIDSTVIDMSSVKPTTTLYVQQKLKEKKINYIDAPVSGGTQGA